MIQHRDLPLEAARGANWTARGHLLSTGSRSVCSRFEKGRAYRPISASTSFFLHLARFTCSVGENRRFHQLLGGRVYWE